MRSGTVSIFQILQSKFVIFGCFFSEQLMFLCDVGMFRVKPLECLYRAVNGMSSLRSRFFFKFRTKMGQEIFLLQGLLIKLNIYTITKHQV